MKVGDPSVLAFEFEPVEKLMWPDGTARVSGYCTIWVAGIPLGDRADGPNPLSVWVECLRQSLDRDCSAGADTLRALSPHEVLRTVYRAIYEADGFDEVIADRMNGHLLAPGSGRPFDLVLIVVVDLDAESVVYAVDEPGMKAISDGRGVAPSEVLVARLPRAERIALLSLALASFTALAAE